MALESLSKAIIAFIVILVLLQLITLALLCRLLQRKRSTRKHDEEKAVELQVRARPSSTTHWAQSYAKDQGQESGADTVPGAYWSHEDYMKAVQGSQAPQPAYQMDPMISHSSPSGASRISFCYTEPSDLSAADVWSGLLEPWSRAPVWQ